MSTADFVIQTFVIVIVLYACWARWGAPLWATFLQTQRNRRTLALLLRKPLPSPVVVASPVVVPDPIVMEAPIEECHEAIDEPDLEDPVEEDEEEAELDDCDEVTEEDTETPSTPIYKEEITTTVRPNHLKLAGIREVLVQPVRSSNWDRWLERVIEGTIHLIAIGQTDAGKTTVLQILVERLVDRGIPVVVCDPDAARGDWPGTELCGGGDDFEAITTCLSSVKELVKQRREARADGVREFPPLWLVLDEYAEIQLECSVAGPIVETLLRRARKLNIHLVLGIQDTQVKSMGFERKSALLQNARTITMKVTIDKRRFAVLEDEQPIAVPHLIPKRADSSSHTPVPSQLPQGVAEEEDDEEVPFELLSKDDAILQMLAEGASYATISSTLHVSTTKISALKKEHILDLTDDGNLVLQDEF